MADAALIKLEEQPWLDRAASRVQPVVTKAVNRSGTRVKNALHGVWLGHPLHPVLTDVPVGAWTAALVMDAMEDMTGNRSCGDAARAAIGIGLVGAMGAAVTGLTDWQAVDGKSRNIGLVHGVLNVTAAGLYGASWAMRGNGNGRRSGRGLSWIGYAIAAASAYIGGKLVYRDRVGVDHTQRLEFPRDFTPLLAESELAEGQMKLATSGNARILVARCGGEVYATAETCSHLGGPLSEGKLDACNVECPWHGSIFSVKDGRVVSGPATHPLPRLEARVREGQIEVRLADPRI